MESNAAQQQVAQTFVMPTGYEHTNDPILMRPVFGADGTMSMNFELHQVYNGAKSEKAGEEKYDTSELCMRRPDKYTKVATRVNDLSRVDFAKYAPLFERFKTQKDSTDTLLVNWQAITPNERLVLESLTIMTVEQLANYEESDLYKLGRDGKDMWERAKRHVATKRKDTKVASSGEVETLQLQIAEKDARLAELEAQFHAKNPKKGA
jgi:hypothetical protein